MRELPTIKDAAKAPSQKIHKLWEGLGYYTRVRNLQKAAKIILKKNNGRFPENFEDVLALPGIGRYTAGAICSMAFNQPMPILDGNVIRVLTRIFGIAKNPKEKETSQLLWRIAEELVAHANQGRNSALRCPDAATRHPYHKNSCSHLNQSLMELGALICTPRNPQCEICPAKKLCVAFRESRVEELPNLGKRATATARHFAAFVIERDGKFLIRQRPEKVVNAHLWEFPNIEVNGARQTAKEIFRNLFAVEPSQIQPLRTVKHSITRYRITLEAFRVRLKNAPAKPAGVWLSPKEFDSLAFTAAHKKLASFAANCILSDR